MFPAKTRYRKLCTAGDRVLEVLPYIVLMYSGVMTDWMVRMSKFGKFCIIVSFEGAFNKFFDLTGDGKVAL